MNWKRNYFTYLEILFIAGGLPVIFLFPKGELELMINKSVTSSALDPFFKYLTHLGDGLIILPLLILLLFVKFRYAAILAASSVYQLILVNINKRLLFNDVARPKVFLEGHSLHFVEGVDVHSYNSFPSGHTTTAFAVFFLLSLLIDNKKWSPVLFLLALGVGFSRIYLMQHFFIDVFTGSILGCLSTILACYTIERINSSKLEGKLG